MNPGELNLTVLRLCFVASGAGWHGFDAERVLDAAELPLAEFTWRASTT